MSLSASFTHHLWQRFDRLEAHIARMQSSSPPSPGGEGWGEGGQSSLITNRPRSLPNPGLLFVIASAIITASNAAPPADLAFFESKIRPLLAEHCYACHSARAEKLKGGLYLDSREGMLGGGDLGPAIVPGDPEKSLLIRVVRYTDADLQMPPKNKKLSDRQIADLTRWVKSGALWPETDKAAARPAKPSTDITDKEKSWWSFQPLRRPQMPIGNRKSPVANPIDAFVRADLKAKDLKPNPPATKRELIRRVYFDLIGLPPTPEAIAAFAKDKLPEAWPRLIDDLLARPQYGERWGRHWLDVARFAQSNGYERDGEKPEAWRYRDYVVRSFNEDKPYDQFIKEQLAGDELDHVTFDSIIATGFQRLGVWDDEPDDKRMAEFDELDDILATTGSAFLGLTIGCARCHEHKFDPIPQADYYRLLGFFRNVRLNENVKYTLDSANYVPLAGPSEIQDWQSAHEAKLKALQDALTAAKDDAEKKKLTSQVESAKAERPPFEFALAVRERGAKPPATHVLVRGNAGSPGAEVQPAFLSVLDRTALQLPERATNAPSSGRRRVLADWIASPQNPLTARVMVNRIWQHHFGRGLVTTTSDFGRAGTPPTHPKLLDWLAAEFIENGWSIKKLHKTILLSQTYQMSSRADNAHADEIDPSNDLLWRQNLRRLEAEALRDTILGLSGRLNSKMGGRGFFPHLSGEVLAGQSRPGLDWEISTPEEQSRRSLYAYVRRTMSVPMLDTFDYSNTTSPLSERPTTTVAPQSLLLLNDEFMQQQAVALTKRLVRECGGSSGKRGDSDRSHPNPLPQEREDTATPLRTSTIAVPSPRSANSPDVASASPSPGGEGRGEGGPTKSFSPSHIEAFIHRGFQLAIGREPTKRERQLARDFIQRQENSFDALRTRLTFRPDVPNSLSVSYMDKLKPTHYLVGPQSGWTYYRGRWSSAYEGIRTMERDRGPFALSTAPAFANGVIETKLVLHTACESGGLLFRATAKEHELDGYEVVLEPREQRIVLRRHAGELATLAQAPASIPMARDLRLKIQATGAHIRIWLGDSLQPVIDFTDSRPLLAGGGVGVRAWGAAMSIDDLSLQPAGQEKLAVLDEQAAPPAVRALQAFCLLLLNLNEVVYVD